MIKIYSNPCVRCGKERIVGKKWTEQFGNSTVVTKEMVCPDKNCQAHVEAENKKIREKSERLKMKNLQKQIARKAVPDIQLSARAN